MVTIREQRESDLGPLRALVLALHEDVRPLDPDLAPGRDILDAHVAHLLALVARTDGSILVAAVDDGGDAGELAGYACLYGRVAPDEVDERPDPYAFLAELYVVPAYRAAGVGGRLMAGIEAKARQLGVGKLELKVHAGNEAARRYYERLGFRARWLMMTKRF